MRPRPTSLRRRVTLTGVAVVTILVLALDVFVYLSLREQLHSSLDRVLDARVQLATGLAQELPPAEVGLRLDDLGVRAVVRTGDGREIRSAAAPSFDQLPPADPSGGDEPVVVRRVALADGGEVAVLASLAGTRSTLDRVLILEAIGSIVVIALAALTLRRASAQVLRPVRDVSATARSIVAGGSQRRLAAHPADAELAEMAAAFNAMLDELEAALARSRASEEGSRRFLADAAHQLRTPVAGIRATVGSLVRTDDDEHRERLLDNLAGESARMSHLLSSLLRVARLDRGEETVREEVEVRRLADELVTRLGATAPRLELQVHGSGTVTGDPVSLREALGNLLDNAAQHARSRVDVRIEPRGDEVRVTVTDDGDGVRVADRERIFDRFVSLRGEEGAGLGLPIARGIARAHDGDLVLEPDGVFALRLPHRS